MHYLYKVYNLFHSEYLVLTINISKACTFFFFFLSLTENFSTTFVRKTPKSTFFFFFFWSLTGFFFPKKLVRQVIKLEWPKRQTTVESQIQNIQRYNIDEAMMSLALHSGDFLGNDGISQHYKRNSRVFIATFCTGYN